MAAVGSSPVEAAGEEEVGAEAGITAGNVTELTEVTGDAVAATEAEEAAATVTATTGQMGKGATTTETETAVRMEAGVVVTGETGEGAVTAAMGGGPRWMPRRYSFRRRTGSAPRRSR